jgi:ABC-type sugar transport system permease subunit
MIISWKGVPYWALFFLAALQGIPTGVLEAGVIDGANGRQLLTASFFRYYGPSSSLCW